MYYCSNNLDHPGVRVEVRSNKRSAAVRRRRKRNNEKRAVWEHKSVTEHET